MAESVARLVGSWPFIIGQSIALSIWVALNITAFVRHWDPYPFILLNLGLSLQAAYTAPVILMAQNRQSEHDRAVLYGNYAVALRTSTTMEGVLKRLPPTEPKLDENDEDMPITLRSQR